jgi:hypothetical protein
LIFFLKFSHFEWISLDHLKDIQIEVHPIFDDVIKLFSTKNLCGYEFKFDGL